MLSSTDQVGQHMCLWETCDKCELYKAVFIDSVYELMLEHFGEFVEI